MNDDTKPNKAPADSAATRRQPMRHCFVSGERHPKESLIRFVVDPDGTITPDLEERLPGRGIWLCADQATINKAIAKKLFAKAARQSVAVPADLLERLERLFVRRCQGLIGLSRRAGQAVAGFEKAQSWVLQGKAGLVIMAQDGGANAHLKELEIEPQAALRAAELGMVFDRARTVYVAVSAGPLARKLSHEQNRLAGVRGCSSDAAKKHLEFNELGLMARVS